MLLPLLLILFGIIELGVVMFDKVTVVHDAREAARLASVNDPAGKTLMTDAPAGSSVTFTCATDPNSGNPAGQYNVGDTITAHVTYSHSFVFPLISSILGNTIDLSSNATFRLEGQPTAVLLMTGRSGQSGGVLVLVAISLTVLLGIAALAIDTGNFRAHRRQLQSAADAGALAGASQLIVNPGAVCGAGGRADYYERRNSDLTDSHNLIKNANLDTSYCELIGNSVRVKPVENDVPYVFGKVLGFLNTDIEARARARVVYLTTARGMMPIGVEDLRPQTVQVIRDDTGGVVASLSSGCGSSPEGFLYYCGGGAVNSLPAGGVPVHVRVTDVTGTVDRLRQRRQRQSDRGRLDRHRGRAQVGRHLVRVHGQGGLRHPGDRRSVAVLPVHDDRAQLRRQRAPDERAERRAGARAGQRRAGSGRPGESDQRHERRRPVVDRSVGVLDGHLRGPENVTVTVKQGNTTYTSDTVQRIYPHDQSTLLYSYTQSGASFGGRFVSSSLAAGAPGRTVNFQTAFVTLTKGREIVLKLGGGNAASPGNFGALDLDTNTSWPQYQCYAGNGTPNFADELVPRRLHALLDRAAGADADRQSDRGRSTAATVG